MKIRKVATMTAAAMVFALASTASPALTFSPFVSSTDLATLLGNNATIGFTYAGDRFVGSVYFGANNNQLYQTDLSGGSVAMFGSPITGFSGEIYVSASLGLGGYGPRDVYAGSQALGTVVRLAHDGSSQSVFASGLVGGVRSIGFDPFGFYGDQMIVATNAGNVYTVSSTGVATLPRAWVRTPKASPSRLTCSAPFRWNARGCLRRFRGAALISPGGVFSTFATVPSAEMLSFVPLSMTGATPSRASTGNLSDQHRACAGHRYSWLLGDIVVTGETTHA